MMPNTTIHDIPHVFYWGHDWRACRPRQHVHIVGFKDVFCCVCCGFFFFCGFLCGFFGGGGGDQDVAP